MVRSPKGVPFLLFLIFFSSGCAQIKRENHAADTVCPLSSLEKDSLLGSSFQEFDQSLPDGGWRKFQSFESSGCAIELIDDYVAKNGAQLEKWQLNSLLWHSGQLSAAKGNYQAAIDKMKKTLKPVGIEEKIFQWNSYVEATTSFLQRDLPSLRSSRDRLAQSSHPLSRLNLRVVDSLIRCFESSYADAYASNCEPKESAQDAIRSLAVELKPTASLPNGFMEFLKGHKVIILGEMHGTQEVPQFFGQMATALTNKNSKTLVVLEINQSSQPSIDRYMASGDESLLRSDNFFSREYQDGRSSRAKVELLRTLRKLPGIKILCMDPLDGTNTKLPKGRDTMMAEFIDKHWRDFDRTLILTGNIHSSHLIGAPWDKNFRTTTFELLSLAKDLGKQNLLNIVARHENLSTWTCSGSTADTCSERKWDRYSSDFVFANEMDQYFVFDEPLSRGHKATLFIRNAKASLPFVFKK